MPNISVLLCAYNAERYISETVVSLLNQTYRDFELVIVNDGSTDNTEMIIKKFQDPRIKYFRLEKNIGVAAATNYGLSKVTGNFIAIADADDIYHPDRLLKQQEYLDQHQDIDLVGTFINYFPDSKIVEESSRYQNVKNNLEKQLRRVVTPQEMKEYLYYFCCLIHSSVMYRRSTLKDIVYDGHYASSTDYQLFYNLNRKGYAIANINQVLVDVRISDNSVTKNTSHDFVFEQLFQIKKDEIFKVFHCNDNLYIWGAGSFGQGLFTKFVTNNFKITGFIDGNSLKWGTQFCGKEVFAPEIINDRSKNMKIIVGSEPGRLEIVGILKQKGYKPLQDFLVF